MLPAHTALCATAASRGSEQSKLKAVPIPGATENIREIKISTVTGVWQKLTPNLRVDFEGLKASVDVLETATQLEPGVEPDVVMQSHDKT